MTKNLNVQKLKSVSIQKHSDLLPNEQVRFLLTGPSGSGKTQRMINMLLEDGFLDYDHLIICTQSAYQLCYKMIILGFHYGLSKAELYELIDNFNDYTPNEDQDVDDDAILNAILAAVEAKNKLDIKSSGIELDLYIPAIKKKSKKKKKNEEE
jgi:hypothetical protein